MNSASTSLIHHVISPALDHARTLPQLPQNYAPRLIEVFFDTSHVYTWYKGQVTFEASLSPIYSPQLIEIVIDGELAFVLLGKDVLLSRVNNLSIINTLLPHEYHKSTG